MAQTDSDGLPVPRRHWAVVAVWLSILTTTWDYAMINVALPTIARELEIDPATSIWVLNAFQLAVVVSLLPLASLGEIVGYRRVYQWGLTIFIVASLSCALAQSLPVLIIGRVAQGIGAAGLMSINGALVRHTYPRNLLGRGIGLNALVVAIASAIGPTVAAGVLALGPWPWLFALNVPIGLAALAIARRSLPVTNPSGRPFDVVGALLNALAFGMLITGLEGLTHGAAASIAVLQLSVAAVAATALVRHSLGQARPLVPFDLLRIPIFSLSLLTSISSFAAQMCAFVSLPFMLQYGYGRSPVEIGLLMTPWPITVAIAAPIAGRLVERYPAAVLGGIGLALLATGLFSLSLVSAEATALDIAWRMALCGAGFGVFQTPNNRTIISSAPIERSGGAGGMLAVARLLGQTTGAVLVAFLFRLQPGQHSAAAPLFIGGVFACLAAVASLSRLRASPPAG